MWRFSATLILNNKIMDKKTSKQYYEKDPHFKEFTKIQIETLKNGCPECGEKLHGVPNNNNTEIYLWCEGCDVSMDSDGGYTN